jgi:hypothetical protein
MFFNNIVILYGCMMMMEEEGEGEREKNLPA